MGFHDPTTPVKLCVNLRFRLVIMLLSEVFALCTLCKLNWELEPKIILSAAYHVEEIDQQNKVVLRYFRSVPPWIGSLLECQEHLKHYILKAIFFEIA